MVHAPYALEPLPSIPRMLLRGLVRRCPLCGSGKLFRWWLVMVDDCPRCDLHFERIEGHWIGAIAINTILDLTVLLGVIVVGAALSYPDPPVSSLMVLAIATAALAPFVFQPVSRTVWTAIDLAMRPLEPGEITEIADEDRPEGDPA